MLILSSALASEVLPLSTPEPVTREELEQIVGDCYSSALSREYVLCLLDKYHSVSKGHWELRSGNHSDLFLRCSSFLTDPEPTRRIARDIAEHFRGTNPTAVLCLNTSTIILATAVFLELETRLVVAEVNSNGEPTRLRASSVFVPGDRVLVIADMMTTGQRVLDLCEKAAQFDGVDVVGVGVFAVRDEEPARELARRDIPLYAITYLNMRHWGAASCPLCEETRPLRSQDHS